MRHPALADAERQFVDIAGDQPLPDVVVSRSPLGLEVLRILWLNAAAVRG
jgi:hypothetical protein